MTMDLASLVLLPLVIARLTRLVTDDVITEWPRTQVIRLALTLGDAAASAIAYLITCRWCASMYVGGAAAAAWWAWGDQRWFTAVAVALAGSYTAGWLASKEDE